MITPNQFYFIRHGLATGNEPEAILTEDGKKQASNVSQFVQSLNFATVYSSPYTRAQETKQIILQGQNFDNREREELEENVQAAYALMDYQNNPGTDLKDAQDYIDKIENVVQEILQSPQPVLVVAHLGTFLAIKYNLKILTKTQLPDNCQLISFEKWSNGQWKINFDLKTHPNVNRFLPAISQPMINKFQPPANLEDLDSSQLEGWDRFIHDEIEQAAKGREETVIQGKKYTILNNAPRSQFFNPSTTEKLDDYTEKTIAWFGFPKKIKDGSPSDKARWKKADASREVQDEYCEWSVLKNNDGKIIRVSFTCEGPEYWEFLGRTNPEKVVELYKKCISNEVEREDLFDVDGTYNPRNKWNQDTTNGAMHLIQVNNTLGAEIELAAGASVVRAKEGKTLTEQQELIKCGKYGAAGRNSDPLIGSEVNALSRMGAMVSLKDPVGLYIDLEEFRTDGWVTPDKTNPREFMKIVRGTEEYALRAIFEVPKEKSYVVGDIKINGQEIKYGAMIADFVRIKLTGIAQNFKHTPIPTFDCVQYVPDSSTHRFLAVHSLPVPSELPIVLKHSGRFDHDCKGEM